MCKHLKLLFGCFKMTFDFKDYSLYIFKTCRLINCLCSSFVVDSFLSSIPEKFSLCIYNIIHCIIYVISCILTVYTDYVLQATSFTFFLINCLKSCLFFFWTLSSFLLYKNVSKCCFVFITYFLFYPICIELKHQKKNLFFFLPLRQCLAMCPVWPGTHYVD